MLEHSHIILAAGTQTRWMHEPVPGVPDIKQLVEVKGEILIERIQNQFPGTVVVTKNKAIELHSKRVFDPKFNETTVATLFSTHELWRDWTTILLGDVDYGKTTRQLLKDQTTGIIFYGDKGEIYAIKWHKTISSTVLLAINKLINHPLFEKRFGKLWNLYRTLIGVDFRQAIIKELFTFVTDCRDFDNKKQYIEYAQKQKVRK